MTQPSLHSVTPTVGGLETETDILVPSLSLGSNLLAACKQPMPTSHGSNGINVDHRENMLSLSRYSDGQVDNGKVKSIAIKHLN